MNELPHWSESQWKNDIRQHEDEVALFFQDLVYCLDLPMDDLPASFPNTADSPSDVVASVKNDALRQWMLDHEEESEEESDADYEPRHPLCFSCVDSLDQLAVEWNIFAAKFSNRKHSSLLLGISCAFAKLLARCADFTEPTKQCTPQLLSTLGKLAVHDLEELAARLNEFASELPKHAPSSAYFLRRLALVREQLIEKLRDLG
jgi:hypothetical protein